MWEQRVALKHRVDIAPVRLPVGHVAALEQHAAAVGRFKPRNNAQRRRFAASGRPKQRQKFARLYVKAHAGQRLGRSKGLVNVAQR